MGGIFDLRIRIPGDEDRRIPLALKGRDTIQVAGWLCGGSVFLHTEILPIIRRGENHIASCNNNVFQAA